jgi:hypothetical protein
MNRLISYEEVAGFLKNPPSLAPRPDFAKIRALRKHITQALKQLDCPQSLIHGWSGLAMDLQMYTMLELNPFFSPPDRGDVPNYSNQFASTVAVAVKTADRVYDKDKNYYLSYCNIHRVLFPMLDKNINNIFKVFNDPNLQGWNPTMSIQIILAQLETSYGKPTGSTLWDNNKVFKSAFLPNEVLESLFQCLEQCQEVAILGENPHTQAQLVMNAVHLLLQSQIFLMKEFEDWERSVSKNWTDLKIFIQGAYVCHLVAVNLCSAVGQNRYVTQNNTFYVIGKDNDEFVDADLTGTTATHTPAAATMNSGITAPSVHAEVVTAINTLLTNQMTMFNQVCPSSNRWRHFPWEEAALLDKRPHHSTCLLFLNKE